ncbi:MAG: hypothetical protein AW09_000853 [Candidatus Accumulibacter phosphatis]|uniref:Uncharacterized protein n=1 Tax=Candidatus Accumulibacter phosphatis TaxID=327160 RepID=A0A080LYG4_9PROT|nr:MAG: hypothetical protein AW09_000853 [Candidatus Accumulibacter phosphatis]
MLWRRTAQGICHKVSGKVSGVAGIRRDYQGAYRPTGPQSKVPAVSPLLKCCFMAVPNGEPVGYLSFPPYAALANAVSTAKHESFLAMLRLTFSR